MSFLLNKLVSKECKKTIKEKNKAFKKESKKLIDLIKQLKINKKINLQFEKEFIKIASNEALPIKEFKKIKFLINELIPWRKGPFSFFGETVLSEWNSHLKWKRISKEIPPLKDKIVCDLGCNNGYFMFQLIPKNPKLILGLDPCQKYKLQYLLIQHYLKQKNLLFELLGYEHLIAFKKTFDLVLSMGILYHHTDPIRILRNIHTSLKTEGKVIVECQGIAGEESVALFPKKKYTNVSGMWFLPTASCLKNWLHRSGFSKINIFGKYPLNQREQSKKKHAPFDSLIENLDPNNSKKTIEGYPSPIRIYASAFKN